MKTQSQHRIMSVSDYNLETIEAGFLINNSKRGCLRVFGILFLLPGLLILAALFQIVDIKTPQSGTGEWAGLFLLGLAFIGFGSAISFYRSHIVIDLRRKQAIRMQGLLNLKGRESFSLENVTEIIISRMVIPDSDGPDQIVYPVIFLDKKGHHFEVGYYREMAMAIRVAMDIAERLGVKIYDTTIDGRPEITAADMVAAGAAPETANLLSRYDFSGLQFKWDGHKNSVSKLLTASKGGINFYKIQQSKFLWQRTIITLFGVGFFIHFFGWAIHETVPKIFRGFLEPNFLRSPEVFFATIIGSAFAIFLFSPIIFLILKVIMPAEFTIIGVGTDGLYLHQKRKRHEFIRYADIPGLDVHAKESDTKKHKFWQNMSDNYLGLRAGTNFYEIGKGLEREQLQIIAEDIKPHIIRILRAKIFWTEKPKIGWL